MSPTALKRVDLEALDKQALAAASPEGDASKTDAKLQSPVAIRWIVIPISLILCVTQAVVTILASNTRDKIISSTIMPVAAFGLLFLLVLTVNPFLRLIRPATTSIGSFVEWIFRPFGRAEMLCIFTSLAVTMGISTFGLTEQLVPLVATPFNPVWNTRQSGWDEKLTGAMNHSLYLEDKEAIKQFRDGMSNVDPKNFKAPIDNASMLDWAQYSWTVCKAVPWDKWFAPLGWWLVFIGASYLMFYSLTYVVLGYWADREKLIFPLARLSESLLPDDHDKHWLPATMRTSGFWAGCFITIAVLAWNALAPSGLIPKVPSIPLGMSPRDVNSVLVGTFLNGLSGGPTGSPQVIAFLLIFTALGLAFLLPLEISFSVWFYYLAGQASVLVATWMGFGRDQRDFPTDWLWVNNHVSAQAGGGFLLFCAISLWKCLRDYRLLTQGKSLGEKFKVAIPVVGFVISLIIIITWLNWNGLDPLWATIFTLLLALVTIGLMRIVSETGIYWFQCHTSFFHVYKIFGLGQFLSPVILGPLIPIYSVLFLDTKTFMAPSLVTSASMAKEASAGRFKFHLNLILCIVITVIVSLGTAIVLAHVVGANSMQSWFYTSGPKDYVMATAVQATIDVPKMQPWNAFWYVFGAGWVALSMYLRTMFFWFPHPAGYIMLINPLLTQLWFPFFMGWAFKKIVVKYGGKSTFDRVRDFFIGIIVGELLAITICTIISLIFKVNSTGMPTLNRYG